MSSYKKRQLAYQHSVVSLEMPEGDEKLNYEGYRYLPLTSSTLG